MLKPFIGEKKIHDIILNVQGDEPFINSNTIESILNTFKHDKENNIKIVSRNDEKILWKFSS